MADDDFGIESLAAYLHVDPAQVLRLVDRGRLPGRKVAGQWRFSPAEVHHWLEERIGLSSDEELVQMEGVLRRAAGTPEESPLSIAEMLPLEAIAIPLLARTRGSAITSMVELAARTGMLWDTAKMAEAVRRARTCCRRPWKMAWPCSIRGVRCRTCWPSRFWRWAGSIAESPSAPPAAA